LETTAPYPVTISETLQQLAQSIDERFSKD
jgi:hypothetical protein